MPYQHFWYKKNDGKVFSSLSPCPPTNYKESKMDQLKTGKLSDKIEFIAQLGSLLFGAVLTTVQIVKTIKGEDEKPASVPVQ